MLLRTAVVLFLGLSLGMCATLGHYQAPAKEEEAPVLEPSPVTESVDAAEEVRAPTGAHVSDSPTAEELVADILAEDQPDADQPVVDSPPAEEPKVDSPLATEPEVDDPVAEEPAVDHPEANNPEVEQAAADVPEVDIPTADEAEVQAPVADAGAPAEEPGTDGDDGPAGDAPAVEAVPVEAVNQEQPLVAEEEKEEEVEEEEEEEDGNDIKPVETQSVTAVPEQASSWGLNSIRSGFQGMGGYFDSLVELVGGSNGVCEYRCRYGEHPKPRPGYQQAEPNGCSTSLVGYEVNAALDMGIPAMTTCCNVLDMCYDTCGVDKYECDTEFRSCLHGICSDLHRSLGFVSKVQACESMADTLYNTVWTLGCRPYMNSQRAACVCEGEERDEL